jgi:uncharacterized iron-regulated protein
MGLALAAPAALAVEAPPDLLATHAGDRHLSWDDALQSLARADVAFLGEQHDDPATHRLERDLLEALHRTPGKPLTLSLEMFERDVQPTLDAYLQGRIPEAEFLAKSRPWPNYATDYRPLIEYAKAQGIPVIAANVPRRLAARVAKEGIAVLTTLPPDERRWAAPDPDCPLGRLWERFRETIMGHPGVGEAEVARMYQAQCLKDATMATAIAEAMAEAPRRVLHVNGAFHSDEGLGVPEQLRRLAPSLEQRVATIVPAPAADTGQAEIVFVVKRPPAPEGTPPN